MLRFTELGVVQAPTCLQVRLVPAFAGRIAAGAPTPSAKMGAVALLENLRHFTVDRGPRERRCTSLVVSGAHVHRQPDLVAVLCAAPDLGFERITRHVALGEASELLSSPLSTVLTSVAIGVASAAAVDDVAALREHPAHVTAAVLLDHRNCAEIEAIAHALVAARPDRIVFTWPLSGPPPPNAQEAAEAAQLALSIVQDAGLDAGVKGLPACRLADACGLWRSANRWYVDVDHQRDQALLFFPDVVRFAKGDACRFCRVDGSCDGAPAQWVDAGLVGPFEPLT